jgi:glycosyltransferase involved in cell wall biosynthesis
MKILFIFHEAQLTGATLALLRNVEWYSENTDISQEFLLKQSGVLIHELSGFGNVYLWENEDPSTKNLFIKGLKSFSSKIRRYRLLKHLKKQKFDLIYANTILCSELIEKTAGFKCKILWHIHELELAIICYGVNRLEASRYVQFIIANSKSTKNNLIKQGIDPDKISVHYPITDIAKIHSSSSELPVRESLGIPLEAFVIGTSGLGIERKGIHDFIQLPLIIDSLYPGNNFYYLWVGKIFNKDVIDYDLEKAGLKSRVLFPGELRDPYPYYKVFDIFISCSKEESFGLSAVEAAAFHKPLVCFKGTGGIEEIVEQAGNQPVPYLNMIEMAKQIIDIYMDTKKRMRLGDLAFETAKMFETEKIMPKMYDYLKKIQIDTLTR